MSRPLGLAAWSVLLAASLPGCSVLLDWGSFTGGATDGGLEAGDANGDGNGADARDTGAPSDAPPFDDAPVVPCEGGACLPPAASGWTGPVTLFTGSGAPPCATPFFSGHAGLHADPATCTACGCAGASGASCADPVMTFFADTGCNVPSGMTAVSATCTPTTSIFQSASVAAPKPTAGTCAGTGGAASTTTPTWSTTGVACTIDTSGACTGGEVCASTPPPTSSATATCVWQTGAAMTCPTAYPMGPQVFYTGIADARGCSPCTCDAPTGVTCSIASPAVAWYQGPCTTPMGQTPAPSTTCLQITPPDPVMLLATPTVSSEGSCTSTGGGMAMGNAAGTGATSFCCLP